MANEVIPFDERLERIVLEEFGEEATSEFMNMLRLGKAAYEHGYAGFATKEKVMEWAGRMYDGGVEQRKIRSGEACGMILINFSDVMNAGAYLSELGERDGYLSGCEVDGVA
ncbi:MAG: hypothetical protein KJ592_03705 [Nanoarchaeota archaeon]|nr:hypothetical protein [Nanoarchaeota archaeon]